MPRLSRPVRDTTFTTPLGEPAYSAEAGPRTTSTCREAASSMRSSRATPSGSVRGMPSSSTATPRTACPARDAEPRMPMFTSSVP